MGIDVFFTIVSWTMPAFVGDEPGGYKGCTLGHGLPQISGSWFLLCHSLVQHFYIPVFHSQHI